MPFFPDQKWVVCFGGGVGPDVWDEEIVVTGATLREVLDSVEGKVQEARGEITSIEIAP